MLGKRHHLGAVWKRSIGNFFEYFEGFSEHGIFHGIYRVLKSENSDTMSGELVLSWYRRHSDFSSRVGVA